VEAFGGDFPPPPALLSLSEFKPRKGDNGGGDCGGKKRERREFLADSAWAMLSGVGEEEWGEPKLLCMGK